MTTRERFISVIGTGEPEAEACRLAAEVGAAIAARDVGVITGGLGGVMEAASRGAAEAGGRTIGFLPGCEAAAANPWVQVAIPTGLGDARNALVATAGVGAIAVGGSAGTLSELALALVRGLPVASLGSWQIDTARLRDDARFFVAGSPEEAVDFILDSAPGQ